MFGLAESSPAALISFNKNPDQGDMYKMRVPNHSVPRSTIGEKRKLSALTSYGLLISFIALVFVGRAFQYSLHFLHLPLS